MAGSDIRVGELISIDQAVGLQEGDDGLVMANSYTNKSGSCAGFRSRDGVSNNATEELSTPVKSDAPLHPVSQLPRCINSANTGNEEEGFDRILKSGFIRESSGGKSGSLVREVLSKQAMRNNVADELGIPFNSDVALQAVAEFEKSISAKCEEESRYGNEEGPQGSSCRQGNEGRMPGDVPRSSIPEEFVSRPISIKIYLCNTFANTLQSR